MPPEHTLMPASRTAEIVSNRSSYERVVITCPGRDLPLISGRSLHYIAITHAFG
jgi:hypothetical protein